MTRLAPTRVQLVYTDGAHDEDVLVMHLRTRHVAVATHIYLLHRSTAAYAHARIAYATLNNLVHNSTQAQRKATILAASLTRLAGLYAYAMRINKGRRSTKRTIRCRTLTQLCRKHRGIPPNPSIVVRAQMHAGMSRADVRAATRHIMTALCAFPPEDISFVVKRMRVVLETGPSALTILQNVKKVCNAYRKGVVRG